MGNTKSGSYTPCHWYRNNMKESIGIPHIEDRADGLIASNLREKTLEIFFFSYDFGETGASLKNQKGNVLHLQINLTI